MGMNGVRDTTILLVNGDDHLRIETRTMLLAQGYTVLEAASGPEALRVSQEHRGSIDLLMTDVLMPDMDGIALAESFASLRANTPVLFVSGEPSAALDADSFSAHPVRLLPTPFSLEDLTRHVREALDDGRAA